MRYATTVAAAMFSALPAMAQSPAAEDGGPRAFVVSVTGGVLNLHAEASVDADIVARLPGGTVLSNLGCVDSGGRAWCDVQPLEGGARGYAAEAFLVPATGPDGIVPTGPDDSALRSRQGDFDATAPIPCGDETCTLSVARGASGYATVMIARPDGRTRIIFFALGRAIGAGTSEADRTGPFAAARDGNSTVVTLGDERCAIPDAVPLGG